uniref:TldD/PmbA family protein n=1 Tax=candidate division WOR-3 bacterium TaxID=2052148 RepID=A0A7C4CA88_UNCW3
MPPRIENEARVRRILRQALAYARTRVDYADVLYERVVRIEVQQLPDQLIAKPFNAKSRVQLRLLDKGRKAEIKVGALEPESLKHAVDSGIKLIAASARPERPVRLAPIPNPDRVLYGTAAPKAFPAAAIFAGLVSGIRSVARQIEKANSGGGFEVKPEFWFFSQREEKAIADSEGVFKTQVMPRTFLQLVTRVKGPDGRMTQTRARIGNPLSYSFVVRRTGPGRFGLSSPAARLVREWMRKTVALQDAITISADEIGKLSHMILHYTAVGVFVHEALGHNFEADIVKSGGSGIIGMDGTPRGEVACPDVHIMDGPLAGDYSNGFGTEFIDDEGVEVKTKLLAQNGKVVGMIHNRETAAFFNQTPNGGAFSEMGDPRIPRMSNTYLLPATRQHWRRTLDELIADIERGIVLVGTAGGAVSKDGMSSSVQIGYLVERGRITRTVKPSNFSAQTLHALRHVDGFAGKVNISDVGFCGKGQSKYVGDGGPLWTRIRNNDALGLSVQG